MDDGTVQGFGFNDDGALGLNHRAHQATPAQMMLPQCVRKLVFTCRTAPADAGPAAQPLRVTRLHCAAASPDARQRRRTGL